MGKIVFAIALCAFLCIDVVTARSATYANPNSLFAFSYDYKVDKVRDGAMSHGSNHGIGFEIGNEYLYSVATYMDTVHWNEDIEDSAFEIKVKDCKKVKIESWFEEYYICKNFIAAAKVDGQYTEQTFLVKYDFVGEPKNMEFFLQIMKSYTIIQWREAEKYFDPELAGEIMEDFEKLHRRTVSNAYKRTMNNN